MTRTIAVLALIAASLAAVEAQTRPAPRPDAVHLCKPVVPCPQAR